MNDLIAVDAWMHNVLSSGTPLSVYKKRFREFNLRQDTFIRNEIQNSILPRLRELGYMDDVEAYEKMLDVLEKIIVEKL